MGQFDELLVLMHAVGQELVEREGAYYRAWGRHLLEDWRSLELVADKLRNAEQSEQRDEARAS